MRQKAYIPAAILEVSPISLPPVQTLALKEHARNLAKDLGFLDSGFVDLRQIPQNQDMLRYIEEKRHGEMGWLEQSMPIRANPAQTIGLHFPSALMLSYSYFHPQNLLSKKRNGISIYAQGRDYHKVLEPKLKQIGTTLSTKVSGLKTRWYTDTGPISEKLLAQAAGLGWIGKSTNLISRHHGSWFFLACILLNVELTDYTPHANHCGTCVRCIQHCPTNAITDSHKLDARLCLSYQSIEKRSGSEPELMAMGTYIYGCDDCQTICPYNRFAKISHETQFLAKEKYSPKWYASLGEEEFLTEFSGSPIRRIGFESFMRNLILNLSKQSEWPIQEIVQVLKNHKDTRVRELARQHL
ncbi:MAG: tRNA epoxyqueuosine(34) reductase QueG [Candidatus Cloacimonetes bacterium]|nr:tRNA epoxyqueuosine(34) reductase QueG [Candidatus Cloacimonadota bacterium]